MLLRFRLQHFLGWADLLFFFASDRIRVYVYLSSMGEHIVTQCSFNVCMPSKIHAKIQFYEAVVLRKIISYRLLPHK